VSQSAVIFGCAGAELLADEAAFFAEAQPWGFILFARNCQTPDQIRRLVGDLRSAVGRLAPVLIDQEGGRVDRLKGPWWRDWLPALDDMARARPGLAARAMWLRYRLIAAELMDLGIDVNCAPLGDVAGADTHAVLRNRCYGTEALAVAGAARAVANGCLAGGVLPVLKHIPGHGRATLDSHKELPRVSAGLDALEAADFAAFRALSDLPLGMTAHIVFEALDPERPATQSAAVIEHIRRQIGFDGLLMTDDLNMQALAGNLAGRARASMAAGCDLVLQCSGVMAEMVEVAGACGALSGPAQARAARAEAYRQLAEPADTGALLAEYRDITGG